MSSLIIIFLITLVVGFMCSIPQWKSRTIIILVVSLALAACIVTLNPLLPKMD